MSRVLTGVAAWLAGTALAVGLAWFGANMVVRDAGMSPGVPVIKVAPASPAGQPPTPPASPPVPASSAPRASGSPAASQPGRVAATSSPSPATTPSPSPSAAGTVQSYTLDGGRVALDVSGDSVTLVTATPDAGFSVQTWSGTDWLRVDFSSGAQVSSLIASWYQHAPTVTVEN
jgi:hypothetical protein